MAFGHGKNIKAYINGNDLSGYFDSIDQAGTAKTAETTTFGSTADSYIVGTKSGTISAEGYFDGSTNAVDMVLSGALAGTTRWVWWPQGDAIGAFGYGVQAINTTYNVKGSIGAAVRVSAQAQSIVGIERLQNLHALGAESASGNSTSQDNGGATTNGGDAYIQVTASTAGGTVIIEHSSDNTTFTTLASFTALSAGSSSERITFSGTVNRYVRAKWTLSSSTITFNVGINRN